MHNPTTARQLALIDLVHRLLADGGVPHWLGRGWGIDFLLTRITRPHGDIDFAVWLQDWPQVAALLRGHGLTLRENEHPAETGRLALAERTAGSAML